MTGRTYPNEINRILHLPGGDVGKFTRKIALEIAEESKRNAVARLGQHAGDRIRTGKLANSYTVKVVPSTNTFRVGNSVKYAAAIELGARAHTIRARRTTYLQFTDRQGRHRRVKMVNHPGNAAFKMMTDAVDTVMQRRGFRRS